MGHEVLLHGEVLAGVRDKPAYVLGSDRNLDLTMNYDRERTAIVRFWDRFWIDFQGTKEAGAVIFTGLLSNWLEQQHAFALSEFGCDKFLSIQPSYFEQVQLKDDIVEVNPVGLSAFGDQGTRYAEANTRVGDGLMRMYQLLIQGGVNTFAMIVSPTEEYKDFNSATDVINLFRVVGQEADGGAIIEGKYIVLGRILSREERRFLHNLAFMVGKQGDEAKDWLDDKSVSGMVATDGLWLDEAGQEGPEHEWLVRRPNTFRLQSEKYTGGDGLFRLAESLSDQFGFKFHRGLIPDSDLGMYPIVKKLARRDLNQMLSWIWDNPDRNRYYEGLRRILYECQKEWARLKAPGFEDNHLRLLMTGQIMAGFEFGFDLGQGQFGHTLGLATEVSKYCRIHDCWHGQEGCPRCRNIIVIN